MSKLFVDDLRPAGPEWVITRNYVDAVAALKEQSWEIVSLDHDLGLNSMSGYAIVKWMIVHEVWPTEALWVHTANPVGSENMLQTALRYAPEGVQIVRANYPQGFLNDGSDGI